MSPIPMVDCMGTVERICGGETMSAHKWYFAHQPLSLIRLSMRWTEVHQVVMTTVVYMQRCGGNFLHHFASALIRFHLHPRWGHNTQFGDGVIEADVVIQTRPKRNPHFQLCYRVPPTARVTDPPNGGYAGREKKVEKISEFEEQGLTSRSQLLLCTSGFRLFGGLCRDPRTAWSLTILPPLPAAQTRPGWQPVLSWTNIQPTHAPAVTNSVADAYWRHV
ncbi:unnamed protein product [Protopolystoma xenopodis]|uniref:Uncharacterized protein n=1 Tax=Protopolystoma xenopodis TaxID=117903 RepID=A0A3S5FFZ6_9PLAT|nr:unnamed protein product [Protopolystoma xenopodis]